MRYAPLAILATIACADADPALVDASSTDRLLEQDTRAHAHDAPVATARDATDVATVSMEHGAELPDAGTLDQGEPYEHTSRPIAVVVVVDINADMADVSGLLNEPGLVALRTLTGIEGADTHYGLVAHADRRAHQLQPLTQVTVNDHRVLTGTSAGVTTCSSIDDMQGWSAVDYDHPVLSAPSCWADELGRDPATALSFAQHMLDVDAPVDAEKAIVFVGGRPPEDLVASERRPEDHHDRMPTWKRTDRFVDAGILDSHARFVVEEITSEGVRVLRVPLEGQDNAWGSSLDDSGAERAWGDAPHEQIESVRRFIDELAVQAAD